MGTQKQPRAVGLLTEKKGVVHLPCRMAIGEIEFGEVIVVGLDVGPLGDGEPHVGEDRGDLVHHLADRMDVTDIRRDRKSTRLNSSHVKISYAVFCLKKKKKKK